MKEMNYIQFEKYRKLISRIEGYPRVVLQKSLGCTTFKISQKQIHYFTLLELKDTIEMMGLRPPRTEAGAVGAVYKAISECFMAHLKFLKGYLELLEAENTLEKAKEACPQKNFVDLAKYLKSINRIDGYPRLVFQKSFEGTTFILFEKQLQSFTLFELKDTIKMMDQLAPGTEEDAVYKADSECFKAQKKFLRGCSELLEAEKILEKAKEACPKSE